MTRQIYRVRAAEDARRYRLDVTLAGMSPDGEVVSETLTRLTKEVGVIQEIANAHVIEEEDVDGKNWLKSIAG